MRGRLISETPLAVFVLAVFVLIVHSAAVSSAFAGTTLFVDASSGGVPDGTTWCTAFTDLQSAIASAVSGDEIRVAGGVYKPDQGTGQTPGDRTASFSLNSGVVLLGGYAGCGAADPDARDVATFETILSGDLAGDDAAEFVNRSDNSYHVVIYDDPNATGVVLDGFTVRGGHADGTGPAGTLPNQGSGIHVRFGSQMCIAGGPTIRNCIVEDNWSLHHGAVNIHADQTLIEGCTIRNNYSDFLGAGLLIQSGNATIRNTTIENNEAKTEGGGVWTGHNADPTCAPTSAALFENCTIRDNVCDRRGGGLFDDGTNIVIRGSAIIGNHSRLAGAGGAWFGPFSDVQDVTGSNPLIEDTLFEGNYTLDDLVGHGGGAAFRNNYPIFRRCTFRGNTAAVDGGGLWGGGENTDSLLEDCLWEGNTAPSGGGYAYLGTDTTTTIRNCIFRDNHATGPANNSAGGGFWIYSGSARVVGTTFERNTASRGGGAFVWQDFLHGGCTGDGCITTFEDCVLRDNEARFGGGMSAGSLIHLFMRRVTFESNKITEFSGGSGGGLNFLAGIAVAGGTATGFMRLEDCVFRSNEAEIRGGGVYVSGQGCTSNSPGQAAVTMIRTDFLGNKNPSVGAGMFIGTDTCAKLYGCRFIGNDRGSSTVAGLQGAGLAALSAGDILIVNSLFAGNHAPVSGGALFFAQTTAMIVNSTFAYNTASNGGAMTVQSSSDVTVANSIVWDNVTTISGAAAFSVESGSEVSVLSSLMQGGFEGVGNFDADPQFINPAGVDGILGNEDDDLRLSSISPALDAADMAALPPDESDVDGDGDVTEPIPIDLDGVIRVSGAGLDLGAYEANALCQPGTFSATGEQPCDPCPAGQFQSDEGGTECLACAPGTFAATTGSAICSPCPAETFQSAMGAAACVPCACDDSEPCTTNGCNAVDGSCENEPIGSCTIPAVSQWGVLAMSLVLLTFGTIVLRRPIST